MPEAVISYDKDLPEIPYRQPHFPPEAYLRKRRDKGAVTRVLSQLRERAAADENLVPFLVEAVENYATIGEICDVFRDVFGEHNETHQF